jgi:sugar phosphate isomerase/epimerase
MPRPHTLFTGQWVDLPLEEVCRRAAEWGFDGLEIACDPRHFDVARAVNDEAYIRERRRLLDSYGLGCWAISAHLVGQAVCDDPIDFRHEALVPPEVWSDGDPEGVRRRAAERMKLTARAAARFGVPTVVGFTGSKIWPYVSMFPPVSSSVIDAGYADFAARWLPILEVFRNQGVKFALEVHPSEIAYDYWTAVRALDAIEHHPAFGFNWDPSHLLWQRVDVRGFLWDFRDKIFHVDCKDTVVTLDGRNGVLGSHLSWGDPRRGFDFVSVGRGSAPWEACLRMLNSIDYTGPISIEWEDAGMNRDEGAPASLQFLRSLEFSPSQHSFDAVFGSSPDTTT